jgi:shikimate dehydrogenase
VLYNIKKTISNVVNLKEQKSYCAIIGISPSKGARSPKIWNYFFKKNQIKYEFLPFDIKPKNLNSFFNSFKKTKNIKSISITNPYKSKALEFVDKINKKQKGLKSINLIKNENQKLIGYNTDIEGFKSALTKKQLSKKKIFIYGGGGGVGKTLLFDLLSQKNQIYAFNRDFNKIKNFKNKRLKLLKKIGEIKDIKYLDIYINCSSKKFSDYNRKLKIMINKIKPKIIYDINYNYKKIELAKTISSMNSKFITGKKMNLYQAIMAINLIFPKYSKSKIKKILLSI